MSLHSNLTDKELLSALKNGDEAAFAEVYNKFWTLMYIYACKMLDKDEAEDVVQEVFASIWKSRFVLAIEGSLSVYLYSAVRYKIFDYFDRQKVRTNYAASLQAFIDQGEYLTDSYIREKELVALIEKEIGLLPPKMRQVFELSRKANLSHKEIAEKLNISDKTVKKQMNKAIKILKLKLGPLFFMLF